jgi:hypothetical protein
MIGLVEQAPARENARNSVLVVVTDDEIDAQSFDRFGFELRETPGGDDSCSGVAAAELSKEVPRFSGGDGGHRAGVEDAKICRFTLSDHPVAFAGEPSRQCFNFADVETTADGIKSDSHPRSLPLIGSQ